MEKKQKTMSLLLAMMLGGSSAALAEVPTSQFGFSGWPYRQSTPCQATPVPTQAAATPQPTASQRPVLTQVPIHTPAPTEQPLPSSTPAATPWATATIAPTLTPVPQSTQTPQPTAAATPTPRPTQAATQPPQATQKPVVATPAPSTDDDYTTAYVGAQEENVFLLLNQDRAANGLAPLQLDPVLCGIARMKSQDMKNNHYFSHTSPTYGSPSEMLRSMGYPFSAAGENIAHHATVEKAQAAFMSSDGHRRNILSSSWTKVGIGVVKDAQGFVYVTQLFVR